MDLLSKLRVGYLYFYTIDGDVGIAEYIEEWQKDDEYLDGGFTERYLTDYWSNEGIDYNTYLSQASEEVIILKELGSAYKNFNINDAVEELKNEFPEYFI